jgi:hypothetical protein
MIYIEFNKKINGDLLVQELATAGIVTEVVVYDGNKIQLNGVEENQRLLCESIISAHNPPAPQEPTLEEKLASVGLNLDDLKAALGLA